MPKKILFCATVDYHFQAFHLPYMKWFKEQGWEVHVAANGEMELPYTDEKFTIPIQRSPLKLANVRAYQQLKSLMKEQKYELIHCHTPLGGVLARLAAKKLRKEGTKVIYTAHGFHFCKGAPIANWLVYYPIEKFLSKYTDSLITINKEDFQLATRHRFGAKSIERIHGVGVNTDLFSPLSRAEKAERRKSFGYQADDFLMFYAAEFNRNKNQQLIIRSLALIKEHVPNAKLLLAGIGPLHEKSQALATELGVAGMIDFLGYRTDLVDIVPLCDIAVGSSFREGLPVNIMEAMACGLPIIASKNRGHAELVHDSVNGYVVPPTNYGAFARSMLKLYQSPKQREKMGKASLKKMKRYSLKRVSTELNSIYAKYMSEESNGSKSKYYRANGK